MLVKPPIYGVIWVWGVHALIAFVSINDDGTLWQSYRGLWHVRYAYHRHRRTNIEIYLTTTSEHWIVNSRCHSGRRRRAQRLLTIRSSWLGGEGEAVELLLLFSEWMRENTRAYKKKDCRERARGPAPWHYILY